MDIKAIEALFGQFADAVDFTLPGRSGSIGEDLLDGQALRISDRARDEKGPDDDWPENKGRYGSVKREAGLPVGRGTETEDGSPEVMLSLLNLKGTRDVEPTEASMTFAVTPDAKDKGNWFTHGSEGPDGLRSGAIEQLPRPFYVLTEQDSDDAAEQAGEALDEWLRSL